MKKISINLLKVSLFLILGLCVFSMKSEVKAVKILRTYFAYPGETITVESGTSGCAIGTGYNVLSLTGTVTGGAKKISYSGTKLKIKLSSDLKIRTSYYMWADGGSYVNHIHIMPEYMISPENPNGHEKFYSQNSKVKTYTMNEGESIQLEVYTKDEKGGLLKQKIADLGLTTKPKDESYRIQKCTTKFEVIEGKNFVEIDQNGKLTAKKAGDAVVKFTRFIEDQRVIKDNTHTGYSELTSIINIKVNAKTPTAPQRVKLTVNYNGGKSVDGKDEEYAYYGKDTELTLTDKYAVKADHKVKGWGTDNRTVKYNNGDTIKLTDDITLFAIWEKIDTGTPIVVKDANGNEIVRNKFLVYRDVTKEGGWNIHSNPSKSRFNEIKDGDIVKILELDDDSRYVKVQVEKTSVEGLTGKEGWLNITENGEKNFTMHDSMDTILESGIVDTDPDTDSETDPYTGIDLSGFGGILQIIMNLVMEFVKNIPTIIQNAKPLIDAGAGIVSALITGMAQ